MPSGVALMNKCIFCDHAARSDSIRHHIAAVHPLEKMLDILPPGFIRIPQKPKILILCMMAKRHGEEASMKPVHGFCYDCDRIMKSPKRTMLPFETHTCKDKQVRTKAVKTEDGKVERVVTNTIRIAEVEKMFRAAGFPVEFDDISQMDIKESIKSTKEELGKGLSAPTEDVVARLKKEPKLKALDIERREKEAIACYAARNADTSDVDSDEEEESYDGYSNVLVPLLYNMIGAVKKSSHQHDTIAEQRIELLQKDAELDNMKEEILRLKKIIEHQSFR